MNQSILQPMERRLGAGSHAYGTLRSTMAPHSIDTNHLSFSFLQLDTATKGGLIVWEQLVTDTITEFSIFIRSITGTPTNGFSWNIYAFDRTTRLKTGLSLAAGAFTPVTASANRNTVMNPGATALSVALTAGNAYCMEVTNAAGTPASNYFTIGVLLTTNANGWMCRRSWDSLATYEDTFMHPALLVLKGTYRHGWFDATQGTANVGAAAAQKVQATTGTATTRGIAIKTDCDIALFAATFDITPQGTAASCGSVCCRVRDASGIVLATSDNSIDGTGLTLNSQRFRTFLWASGVVLNKNLKYYISLEPLNLTTNGSTTNYWTGYGVNYSHANCIPVTDGDTVPWNWRTITGSVASGVMTPTIDAVASLWAMLEYTPLTQLGT